MQMQLFHAARAADRVDTAGKAATAFESRQRYRWIAGQCRGHWPMSPLASEAAVAVDELAVNHQPAADTCSKDNAEDDAMSLSGADFRFGDHETIRIVRNDNGKVQGFFQIVF
ncbi:hypothetical protein D3C87_1359290 [compost metagenome]